MTTSTPSSGERPSSLLSRSAGRKVYAYWFLALLLVSVLPAIGPGGFVISRANFTFLLIAFPVVALAQWYLTRRLMRRALLQLLKQEKPGKGQLGSHRVVLSEDGVVERTAAYTSPVSAHVIPKRAFRDMPEAQGFYQFGRVRKEAVA